MFPPQHRNDAGLLGGNLAHDKVRELRPPHTRVSSRLSHRGGEVTVEQEDAFGGPRRKIAMRGEGDSYVLLQFLSNVSQACRQWVDVSTHRESTAAGHRLRGVRVLANNQRRDGFWRRFESSQDELGVRRDAVVIVTGVQLVTDSCQDVLC